MAKKIVRKKLKVDPSADIHHLVVSDELTVYLGKEGEIFIPYVRHIEQSNSIVRELNIYIRKYTKKRVVTNQILRYIQYLAHLKGAISVISLCSFRDYLNTNSEVSPSAKAQTFNNCRNFVSHFMASGNIPDSPLPKPLSTTIGKGTKRSFSEIAGSEKELFKDKLLDIINQAKKLYKLGEQEALTYAYCKESMRAIHEFSLMRIHQWQKDCIWVDSIICKIKLEDASALAGIKSFKASEVVFERTIDLAFKILFSKFGRALPPSTQWPIGISDFLKRRGWSPRRVCGAFFPTTVEVGDYLTAILSHEKLCPNVDAVAFGLYIDGIKPAFDKGFQSVFFDKNRGDSTPKYLASTEDLAKSLVFLKDRMRNILIDVPGGQHHLAQHNAPIFVHITNFQGRGCSYFRTLDPSSTSNLVSRVIKLAAGQHEILKPLHEGHATGANFRTTHAVIKRLSGMSDSEIKIGMSHKSLATTASYTDRVETSSVIMGKYQDFQRYLITESLNMSRTGSGYFCSEPVESVCGDFDKCFSCDAKRIVLKDPEVAAEWIAWRKKIEASRSRLEMNNPDRWSQHWSVKLVEYQALIDQLDQRTFKQASKLATNVTLPHLD